MKANEILLNSLVLIGDYLLYVYMVVPVGFFINIISNKETIPSNFFLVNFFLYMTFLSLLIQQYNLITQKLIKNSFQKSKIIFNIIIGYKNIFNKIYLFSLMSFIATFGFFLDENHSFLYLLSFIFSYTYFFYAIKYAEFSTFFIYVFIGIISIYVTLFYTIYASVFLYILVVFYVLKIISERDMNSFDIR